MTGVKLFKTSSSNEQSKPQEIPAESTKNNSVNRFLLNIGGAPSHIREIPGIIINSNRTNGRFNALIDGEFEIAKTIIDVKAFSRKSFCSFLRFSKIITIQHHSARSVIARKGKRLNLHRFLNTSMNCSQVPITITELEIKLYIVS